MVFDPRGPPARTTFPIRPCSELRVPAWSQALLAAAQSPYKRPTGGRFAVWMATGPSPQLTWGPAGQGALCHREATNRRRPRHPLRRRQPLRRRTRTARLRTRRSRPGRRPLRRSSGSRSCAAASTWTRRRGPRPGTATGAWARAIRWRCARGGATGVPGLAARPPLRDCAPPSPSGAARGAANRGGAGVLSARRGPGSPALPTLSAAPGASRPRCSSLSRSARGTPPALK